MKRFAYDAWLLVCLGMAFPTSEQGATSKPELKVAYGPNGIQTLSYGQQELENVDRFPADAFHIWHMKATNLRGEVLTEGQYGWGENHTARRWDAAEKLWTYEFTWGSIKVQFSQAGSQLDIKVTEANRAGSGIIFDGATIYPFALHFPSQPSSFADATSPQLTDSLTAPGVIVAKFGSSQVAAVSPDPKRALYSGFLPQSAEGHVYTPLVSSTAPDGVASFLPHYDRPVKPGETDSFTVSLRFDSANAPPETMARDAYENWAKRWPEELHWTDRRVIGTVYLASSPQGSGENAGGYPHNPRRYFDDANANDFDVTSPGGLAAFQSRILKQAHTNVKNLTTLQAQGVITWDIEGEEYPQSTSYVCEPDAIATIAPEMESIITAAASPYHGMKLDDAYFKIMTEAGFRVGVCVRPQHFTRNANGTAQQLSLPDTAVATELIRKIQFAHDRWGATLFYIDSSVDRNGVPLDASIFRRVARAFPDSLIVPEESTFKYYAYTAPFKSFLFHGDLGTESAVRASYPHAFSVNLINDVNAGTLAAKTPYLTRAVHDGDILMPHVDYWQENNPAVLEIYKAAETGVQSQ